MPGLDNTKLRKADVSIINSLSPDKYRQIRDALLDNGSDGHGKDNPTVGIKTYTKIAYLCDVSIAAVRAVARSMRSEMQVDELARMDELRRLVMAGATSATSQLLDALDAGEIRPTQLPTVAGIFIDKYMALRAADPSTASQASLTVTVSVEDIASTLAAVLQRAADRRAAVNVDSVVVDDAP